MNPLLFIKPLLGVAKPLLGLVKNPVVDLVISKTTGAIQHKMDKDKIIRAKEIEGATKIDVAHINAQKDSIKDEIVVCTFLGLLICHFVPYTQPHMEKGWAILQSADPMFWIMISIVVSASMGVTGINKIISKKK
jgi:hypothetical protein|tara:strand:+ start:199 stop:603 length:405 start_codon:yes stop_codon:yes gene_type:complete